PLLICLMAIAIFLWVSISLTSVLVFVPGVIVSYLAFLQISKRELDSHRILPLYLVALAVQLLHFTEEYLTDFVTKLPELFNQPPYPINFWIVFNMIAYAIFILGAISLFQNKKEFYVIPLFFILIGVVFNGIAHVLLAAFVGDYFPGLFTALAYLIIGPMLLRLVFQ
ncbi:MAG: HXXEE domain-containing protein, partial [Saprospiraceae bacterium]|nr:HXXEE domain-containing protein [Saprospiraceae bacterium]